MKTNQFEVVAEWNHSEGFATQFTFLWKSYTLLWFFTLLYTYAYSIVLIACTISSCASEIPAATLSSTVFRHPSLHSYITVENLAQMCHLVVVKASSLLFGVTSPYLSINKTPNSWTSHWVFCLLISLPANIFVWRAHISWLFYLICG